MTKYKQNRHEVVAAILKCGTPVSPADIIKQLEGTKQANVAYRLSTNIYNIKRDGGVVKVHKDGTKVTAYQLMNPNDFNDAGRYIK